MFTKILSDFIYFEFWIFNSKLQKIKIQDLNIKINKKGINIFFRSKKRKKHLKCIIKLNQTKKYIAIKEIS
jgi:hypothetical protein